MKSLKNLKILENLAFLSPTILAFVFWNDLPSWLTKTPAAVFYLTNLFAIWFGGLATGMLAITLTTIFHFALIRPHLLQFPISDIPGLTRTLMFLGTTTLFALMISSLKRSREALRHAVSVRDEFLSLASHELKTPVTVLKLQIDIMSRMLLSQPGEPSKEHAKLTEILRGSERQVRHLTVLIDELLDVSNITRGKLSLELEHLNFSDVCQQICNDFRLQGGARRLELLTEIQSGIHASWDKRKIEQLLSNLLSNAFKFGHGKAVHFSFFADEISATFKVKDQGNGIDTRDHIRIFEKFEQVSPKRSPEGLGLGLYICKQIALLHGGRIWVQSQIGQGSTFFVSLPLKYPYQEEI